MDAVRERRESMVRAVARAAAVCCLGVAAAGCRTGSWVSKPSWMTFGQKTPDAGPLASQPALAGDVQKPSATAKPYPTTSTPDGYSLPAATAQAAVAPGAAPAVVTYGVTPPPATAPEIPPAAGTTAAIAPQVGPYAPSTAALPPEVLAGNTPESARTAPALAAVPSPTVGSPIPAADPLPSVSTAPPPWATAPTTPPPVATPPQRYADARAASPAWTPSAVEPPPADGRYAASGTSRFGGAVPAAAASMLPVSAPPASFTAPPAELPPPVTSPTPSAPTAPLRRPDPDYRPGGTSSYRPSRSSLAAEPSSGVQPVSFEAVAGPGPN